MGMPYIVMWISYIYNMQTSVYAKSDVSDILLISNVLELRLW